VFNTIWQVIILLIVAVPAFLFIERPFMERNAFRALRSTIGEARMMGNLWVRRGAVIVFLMMATGVYTHAQDRSAESPVQVELLEIDPSSPELITLKPLDEIIEYASLNSPLLKSSKIRTEDLDHALSLIRSEWTEYIYVNGSYNYGTSAFLDQTETAQLIDFRTVNRRSSFYNIGVSVRIPLSTVLQRGPRVRQIETQKQLEALTREEVLANLRKEVIREYNTFRNKIKVIAVKNDKVQSLGLAAQYAEQLLQNGQLDLVEYTTIVSRQSQTLEELENLRSEALLSYLILNDICGGNITE
jgi:outer membrane protein TolC